MLIAYLANASEVNGDSAKINCNNCLGAWRYSFDDGFRRDVPGSGVDVGKYGGCSAISYAICGSGECDGAHDDFVARADTSCEHGYMQCSGSVGNGGDKSCTGHLF